MKIAIINGPNLNLTGIRQTEIYGETDFGTYMEKLRSTYPQYDILYFQSNHAGEIIDKVQEIGFSYDAILLNAGAYTHTSMALGDAVASIQSPVIEIHISNIFSREHYRHNSYISKHARALICGFGLETYALALHGLNSIISPKE
jgi:3-dehydroquinate dehydratase II